MAASSRVSASSVSAGRKSRLGVELSSFLFPPLLPTRRRDWGRECGGKKKRQKRLRGRAADRCLPTARKTHAKKDRRQVHVKVCIWRSSVVLPPDERTQFEESRFQSTDRRLHPTHLSVTVGFADK